MGLFRICDLRLGLSLWICSLIGMLRQSRDEVGEAEESLRVALLQADLAMFDVLLTLFTIGRCGPLH